MINVTYFDDPLLLSFDIFCCLYAEYFTGYSFEFSSLRLYCSRIQTMEFCLLMYLPAKNLLHLVVNALAGSGN